MIFSEYDKWYNSLPSHTKDWLKNQPVWYDVDLFLAFIAGILLGSFISWIL
jgi:F0F1-type ATP synthase assembly protein I